MSDNNEPKPGWLHFDEPTPESGYVIAHRLLAAEQKRSRFTACAFVIVCVLSVLGTVFMGQQKANLRREIEELNRERLDLKVQLTRERNAALKQRWDAHWHNHVNAPTSPREPCEGEP